MVRAQPVLERLPFEKLHDDERLAFVLINVVNRADIRVIKRGSGLGLALEAFECLMIFGERLRQELESDKPVQLGVLGLIDHTHASAAQLFEDSIVGNGFAGHVRRALACVPES